MSDFKAKITAELDTSKVDQQLKELDGRKIKLDTNTSQTQKEINKVNTSLNTTKNTAKSFGDTLKRSLELGTSYSVISTGFRAIQDAATKAVEAVKGFDSAITDLRMATGDTYAEVSKLVQNYNEFGQALGATTNEVSQGADAWLRQGHSVADTNTLIKDSMILSKVANIESTQATQLLTASIKGYGVAVEDVIGIVDKLTSVDLVSATDAGGLAEAMSRTAVTANTAGVSMNQLLGYLATVGEVTQKSMSSVGESFKTIFTRMSDIKAGKLELVDEDGTTETLSDVEQTLKNVGIDLRATVNEYNNYGDVLDNLAGKWNSLSKVQQNALVKAFAGTRQSENFRSLMENYDSAKQYAEIAANSTGTAEKKFEAYLDSLYAKTKSLQASFESLAINTLSTDVVGSVLDSTSAVIQFTDKTNLLKGSLVGLATVGAIKGFSVLTAGISNAVIRLNQFNSALQLVKAGNIGSSEINLLAQMTSNLSKSQLKVVLSSKALSDVQRKAILTTQGLTQEEAQAALTSMGLASAERTATASTVTFKGAVQGLWATLKANPLILILSAVTAVVSAYSTYKKKLEEAKQAAQEAVSAYKEQAKTLQDTKSKLSELAPEYAKLSKGVDKFGENTGLTADEFERYHEVTSQIADMFPDLIQGYDDQGNAILSCKGNVEELTEAYNKLAKANNDAVLAEGRAIFKNFSNTSGDLLDSDFSANDMTSSTAKALEEALSSPDIDSVIDEAFGARGSENANVAGMNQVIKALKEAGLEQQHHESAQDFIKRAIKENRHIVESVVQNFNTQAEEAVSEIQPLAEAFIGNAFLSGDYSGITSEMQSVINSIISGFDFDFYSQFDKEKPQDLYDYLSTMLSDFNNLTGKDKNTISVAFNAKTELSNGECSVGQYLTALENAQSLIGGFDEKTRSVIELALQDDNIEEQINNVKDMLDPSEGSNVGRLSLEDLEIAQTLDIPKVTRVSWQELIDKIDEAKSSIEAAEDAQKSFVSRMSNVESMSKGFDQIDKIYADVKDKGSFDFSAILNNDDFANAFGDLDSYDEFIETIASSPKDINACQGAFNKLVTEYVNGSEVLKELTDDTRDATIAFLKQNGVSNATEVVDRALAVQKARLALETGATKDKVYEEIAALYGEETASKATEQAFAQLKLEKQLVNTTEIDTSKEVAALIEMANAAYASGDAVEYALKAKNLFAVAEQKEAYAKSLDGYGNTYALSFAAKHDAEVARQAAEDYISGFKSNLKYDTLKVDDFEIPYSGGSVTNKSSDSSSNKPKDVDWIEIAINRIESAIDKLGKVATSSFKSLKTRLSASSSEISKVNKELDIQQKAYDRYMKQADSIKLSSSLKEQVRNGTIDIEKYDSKTQELISSYKDWHEKALGCSDAIDDLHESLAGLYEGDFDTIAEDFDNQLGLLEHKTNTYNSKLDIAEAKGYLASKTYYTSLQDVEKKNITVLQQELAGLEQSLSNAVNSGEIEKYSSAWYDMKTKIDDVKESIDESTLSVINLGNSIRDIEWEVFDLLQGKISQVTQESDFLLGLLEDKDLYDDKGQLTDDGMSAMGLHGVNYNVYMSQADEYAREIQNIDKQLAKDPYNQDLLTRRQDLLKLQQESIDSAENEKQAIVDLVKGGVDVELESLKGLIDTYKDALDSAKDLYDYQKKLKDHTSEISSLQKQLLAYEDDDSEETKAKVQQLKVDLENAEEDLEETQYDQYISDQKQLLDSLYDEYELILNQRFDNVDALIGDAIDAINDNSGLINSTLTQTASDAGYTLSGDMQSIWDGSAKSTNGVISGYGDDFAENSTSTNEALNNIKVDVAKMVLNSEEEAGKTEDPANDTKSSASNTKSDTNKKSTPDKKSTQDKKSTTDKNANKNTSASSSKKITVGGQINAKGAKIYDYAGDTSGGNQYYANDPIYKVLKEQNGWLQVRYHKLSSGVTGWFKKNDVKAYKTGGLVDYTGLAWMDGTKSKPESVLDAKDTENLIELKEILRNMPEQELFINNSYGYDPKLIESMLPQFTTIPDFSAQWEKVRNNVTIQTNAQTTFGDTNINIDHVQDYNDFVNQLRDDPKFEKMIQAMTVNRIAGKSEFGKNRYKW